MTPEPAATPASTGRQAYRSLSLWHDTLAASGDRVAAWRALDLSARRTVIDALMTVTLLPGRFGKFDPATVQIEWKT